MRWAAGIAGSLILVASVGAGVAIWTLMPKDAEKLIPAAQSQVQAQLDGDFSPGAAKVMAVKLVRDGNKYDGSASLLVLNRALNLPFNVSADGKTVVATIASGDIGRVQSSLQDQLSDLTGKPSAFILEKRFHAIFPKELTRDGVEFEQRLQTVSAIMEDGNYYYGHGCKAHSCTLDEAAWVIDKKTAHLIAVIGHVDLGKAKGAKVNFDIKLYGKPKGQDDLPPPLEKWKNDMVEWLNSTANSDGMMDAMRGAQATGSEQAPSQ